MLTKLTEKIKNTDSRVWKWILGVLVTVGVALLGWYIKRQAGKVAVLEAEKKLADERAKDAEVEARNEADKNLARALKEEAERLRAKAAGINARLIIAKAENEAAKKRVDDAKDWEQLEKEARGK